MTKEKNNDLAIDIVEVATDLLDPNDYNPNRMTEAEFSELVNEVVRLGRLPKPVVVRRNDKSGRYLIVDGEHGWRAAAKAGLEKVPCELIEADDFEAMRQTYKRNQHGTHAPILLGKFFKRMMEERGLSQRALAQEIDVSEGSIRNALQYVQAASVRNGYAWETLTVRQVRLYNRLPRSVGDLWVDTGANVKELLGYDGEETSGTMAELERAERRDGKKERLYFPRWEYIEQTGLIEDVIRQKHISSSSSFAKLIKTVEAFDRFERKWSYNGVDNKRLRPYTRHFFLGAWPVRNDALMDDALELLIDASVTPASFRLSPKEFEAAVKEAGTAGDFFDLLKAMMVNKGITPPTWQEQISAKEKLMATEINRQAPDYIKQSVLGTRTQYALWKAEGPENIKRDIAATGITMSVLGRHDNDDRVKWCIEREIEERMTDAEIENASTADLVGRIAARWGLYDISQKEQIERLSKILIQLTRDELVFLYGWSAGIERERESLARLQARWAAEDKKREAWSEAKKETP